MKPSLKEFSFHPNAVKSSRKSAEKHADEFSCCVNLSSVGNGDEQQVALFLH